MSHKINILAIFAVLAIFLFVNTDASPIPQVVPVVDPVAVGQQIAYQNAVLQQQVAAGVNQIATNVAIQANVAMQQAAVQQAQVANAVNQIAAQTVG